MANCSLDNFQEFWHPHLHTNENGRLSIGKMDSRCRHCNALHWIGEKQSKFPSSNPQYTICCGKGKVRLPPTADPPQLICDLLTGQSPYSSNFRANLRA